MTAATQSTLTRAQSVSLFLSFAFAYFLSNLARAITATIAPDLRADFNLNAGDLGLLAGGYFLGFFTMQIPLGKALDRFGPKSTLLAFLLFAVLGSAGFASAGGFTGLLLSRIMLGCGVAACLMAPMTAFRHSFTPELQLRANSWMLMTGALGMLASTLPVRWALPLMGWRGVYFAITAGLVLSIALIAYYVPRYRGAEKSPDTAHTPPEEVGGYAQVMRHPYFLRVMPMALIFYGGISAMQTLWVGPWLNQVSGQDAQTSAAGLFQMNVVMLLTFLAWGSLMPRLNHAGWSANRLINAILPLSLAMMLAMVLFPEQVRWWWWALFLVGASPMSFAQPTLAMQFPAQVAGRALTLFNLQIFAGSFFIQWGFGLSVDVWKALGHSTVGAYQITMAIFGFACLGSYLWFVWKGREERLISAKIDPA